MYDSPSVKGLQNGSVLLLVLGVASLVGCRDTPPRNGRDGSSITPPTILQAANLGDPMRPAADSEPIRLRAARNEWVSFALQVTGVFSNRPLFAHVSALTAAGGGSIGTEPLHAYQILPTPMLVNPGYVRLTGVNSPNRSAPRALLPVEVKDGLIPLASLRDPTQPTNAAAHPNGGTVLLWVEFRVPINLQASDYIGTCNLADGEGRILGEGIPLRLAVDDFTLPDERHLQILGRLNWERLANLYPELFGDTITPNLINRGDPRYRRTIAMLDQLTVSAEVNRLGLQIVGLRPTVKWPAGEPPQIQWHEFDSVIAPWMNGELFPDRVPIKSWILPAAYGLGRYDSKSRQDYWSLAAAHFDQLGWLDRSPIWMDSTGDARELAKEAGRVLADNSKVRVAIPLQDNDLGAQPQLIEAANAGRLLCAAAPLVSPVPPAGSAPEPLRRRWLPIDWPGPGVPVETGGDERDIRACAWLAFLRGADTIVWSEVFPSVDSADDPADPLAVTWFYPGQWFGVAAPLQTLQLKWLRQAQQDYEYLWLAKQRGEAKRAIDMARLVTKPVEVAPGSTPDPEFALLSGTTSQPSWDRARELLAQSILLHGVGRGVDQARQQALLIEMLQWSEPQERPLLLPRSATWSLHRTETDDSSRPGDWLNLRLGIDVYNASDSDSARDQLRWSPPPPLSGWEIHPQPLTLARLQTYRVQLATLSARFNLKTINPDAAKPMEVNFINGFRQIAYPFQVRLPVARSESREGSISLDGKLNDWSDSEAIQDGPLVLMLNRPALHRQQIQFAEKSTKIYSTWGRDNFYLAFSLDGLSPDEHQAHNDVYYQARRAWGEDLCEVLIQPVYADDSIGPVLYLVCKPNGGDWVERKEPARDLSAGWRTTEGSGIRYATTTTTDGRWRGELGIPWKLINADDKNAPVLLRFNFSQHRQQNCESASWCGPVDFGRDEKMMGVLYLRQNGY